MDNLTHTLVGATLGRAGLARRTSLGMAALMIGANLPDVDAFGLPFGWNLGFRRGVTHGLPALLVWPWILTGLLLAWHRWRARHGHPRARPDPRQLMLLATIAIVSHPVLDWLNSYGMRWLMPIDGTWYYGDTLFIVDPWVLLALGLGLWLSRPRTGRSERPAPARSALILVGLYIVAMWIGSWAGRRQVAGEAVARGYSEPRGIMVTPVPVNPLWRQVLVDDGGTYHLGRLRLGAPTEWTPAADISARLETLDTAAVLRDPQGRQFLGWSRFPFVRIRRDADTTVILLDDARYAGGEGRSFAATEVRVPTRR